MEGFVVMDLSSMSERVRRAFEFASYYHQGQKRKGGNEEYIMHPYRVWKVVKEFSKNNEVAECAALLHDVVEDSEVTIEDIKQQFGFLVAQIVAEVSLSKEDKKNLTWAQKKAKTIFQSYVIKRENLTFKIFMRQILNSKSGIIVVYMKHLKSQLD